MNPVFVEVSNISPFLTEQQFSNMCLEFDPLMACFVSTVEDQLMEFALVNAKTKENAVAIFHKIQKDKFYGKQLFAEYTNDEIGCKKIVIKNLPKEREKNALEEYLSEFKTNQIIQPRLRKAKNCGSGMIVTKNVGIAQKIADKLEGFQIDDKKMKVKVRAPQMKTENEKPSTEIPNKKAEELQKNERIDELQNGANVEIKMDEKMNNKVEEQKDVIENKINENIDLNLDLNPSDADDFNVNTKEVDDHYENIQNIQNIQNMENTENDSFEIVELVEEPHENVLKDVQNETNERLQSYLKMEIPNVVELPQKVIPMEMDKSQDSENLTVEREETTQHEIQFESFDENTQKDKQNEDINRTVQKEFNVNVKEVKNNTGVLTQEQILHDLKMIEAIVRKDTVSTEVQHQITQTQREQPISPKPTKQQKDKAKPKKSKKQIAPELIEKVEKKENTQKEMSLMSQSECNTLLNNLVVAAVTKIKGELVMEIKSEVEKQIKEKCLLTGKRTKPVSKSHKPDKRKNLN
ncbi:hypothetical protein EIN_273220 [Entamoeba invadens IP1]|uniref:RRM domain-containing protein n=1 Tax=Entamoeba invadens IP1 TaxID=370355 RepID=A0A0A1U1A0_ENTIV|nr:hypothetical protein EIN_273220 [Entamoeba invadens IP1]ELP87805.1 hypothetical protein EIN_273220 [Entamoeba invadens IP1]|eukprot:XP_004254576.1 hypothetical protein EIN_273220 [Entamoeba invadens IP1]